MFSGIVEELGLVRKISRRGNTALFEIAAKKVVEDLKIGDSVAVNGVCLTAVKMSADSVSFEALPETLKVSNLGVLRILDKLNLERSLKVGDRVSGHFVTGHVDCVGIIRRKGVRAGNLSIGIAIPPEFIKHCLLKGSIAVDGISLTIQAIQSNLITVYIIPHTLKNTTLSFKGPSNKVNIEFDILSKKA
ncbi:MAG: riboflavin synthase [Candidatus Omnitrophica bacterium]|nr:riboflavin synthase [Candidatus Omnitrophota bacterium]MBU1869979.1 riboflavin synthase [Candidatus Omnitrophota bacterium]